MSSSKMHLLVRYQSQAHNPSPGSTILCKKLNYGNQNYEIP